MALEYTPTWALATVTTFFIVISLTLERLLHVLGHYLHRTKRKQLLLTLQKLKDELMLVGFISLTITIFTTPISKICIKSELYDKWTPCDIKSRPNGTESSNYAKYPPPAGPSRRLLAAPLGVSYCKEGYEPFMGLNTLHQLHIFIFVLVGVHVVYSCITMVLALTKVYAWGKWEREAHAAVAHHTETELAVSVNLTRRSTIVRYHASKPLGTKLLVWVVCFFKQFYVPRADYLTLRLSFVTTHNLRDNYDFHAYMIRCMEDEFETIVGISIWLWGFVIAFLLFSIAEPVLHFWASILPVTMVLIIGMKLQHIIATLALEHSGVNGPFVGVLLKPRDQLFWFNRPNFLLHIIHFVLFESAFELATFIWHVSQFQYKTCLLGDNKTHLYFRLFIGVATQILCCFTTLPLYALVSQMSSMPKKTFLPKNVERSLRKWHQNAKHRLKLKVLERYQKEVGQRRMMANAPVTPLDERYFLQTDLPGNSQAPSNGGPASRPATTPMSINMEEGSSFNTRTSTTATATRDSVAGNRLRFGVQSERIKGIEFIRHNNETPRQPSVEDHTHLLKPPVPYKDLRRRASPKGPAMDLHIPPFQPQAQMPSPTPLVLQRSFTTSS